VVASELIAPTACACCCRLPGPRCQDDWCRSVLRASPTPPFLQPPATPSPPAPLYVATLREPGDATAAPTLGFVFLDFPPGGPWSNGRPYEGDFDIASFAGGSVLDTLFLDSIRSRLIQSGSAVCGSPLSSPLASSGCVTFPQRCRSTARPPLHIFAPCGLVIHYARAGAYSPGLPAQRLPALRFRADRPVELGSARQGHTARVSGGPCRLVCALASFPQHLAIATIVSIWFLLPPPPG